jgi:hypothetical protein
LTDCLVYLDEAHCRGTDLKIPAKSKGALTLGELNSTFFLECVEIEY